MRTDTRLTNADALAVMREIFARRTRRMDDLVTTGKNPGFHTRASADISDALDKLSRHIVYTSETIKKDGADAKNTGLSAIAMYYVHQERATQAQISKKTASGSMKPC